MAGEDHVQCRYCFEQESPHEGSLADVLIQPCACSGSVAYAHVRQGRPSKATLPTYLKPVSPARQPCAGARRAWRRQVGWIQICCRPTCPPPPQLPLPLAVGQGGALWLNRPLRGLPVPGEFQLGLSWLGLPGSSARRCGPLAALMG